MESGLESSSRVLRSGTTRYSTRGKKKQKIVVPEIAVPNNSPADRLYSVLELGSALVWEYLCTDDVRALLQTCSGAFSQKFLDIVSLKAIETFAVENEIHLGRRCACDWMRGLDFLPSRRACNLDLPFGVDKTLSIFQEAKGAQDLVRALLLTKTALEPLYLQQRIGAQSLLAPVVCPLLKVKENPTERALTRAMNSVCRKAGSRFFYSFKQKRGRSSMDYLDYHWDEIESSSCQYCDHLPIAGSIWRREQFRANCKAVYRPLKAAMEKNLTFLRFIPQPRGLRGSNEELSPYKGLVAGITPGGVLCGFYLVNGYKP
ncbi:hypothetical protein PF008_g23366 [Phytophthora fragariae]|uniref:Uncharacterized protein n=1 Tax=Phytophthora fragariae TaxID=53985 RepID=A0A6G0QQZ5_9STRA|nr:hypothetical protein PF008_g23366 [Phytophthora fragariae]